MKRLRIMAALIRRLVRERPQPLPPLAADPLSQLTGAASFEPAPVDDIVYSDPSD
jgi:hypothetical protein